MAGEAGARIDLPTIKGAVFGNACAGDTLIKRECSAPDVFERSLRNAIVSKWRIGLVPAILAKPSSSDSFSCLWQVLLFLVGRASLSVRFAMVLSSHFSREQCSM